MSQNDGPVLPRHEGPQETIDGLTADSFRLLVQSVVDYAIFMLDSTGRIASWNPGACRIKGYAAEEVLGKNFALFYTKEDRAKNIPARNLEIAARLGRYSEEAWRVRRDGSRFRALIAIDAIRGANGELLGFAKVTCDVTERWQAKEQLKESELRFRLFAEGAPEYALCMLDTQHLVRHWNESAFHISGYRKEEVVGQPLDCLLPTEEHAALERMFEEAGVSGSCEAEQSCVRKNGDRFLAHVSLRALRDELGNLHGFAYLLKDISEQRAAEVELEATHERLFQSRKMGALGRLTGGIAHDFNNILHAAMGRLEVAHLQLQRGDPHQADYHVTKAAQSLEHAAVLTRRLLIFARRQPLVPVYAELNNLVRSLTDLIERTLDGSAKLDISLYERPMFVMCDVDQFEMALLCLVTNSRDAMPQGGCLTISMHPDGFGEKDGREAACLTVEDNGDGMTADVASHAFEPFFSAKPIGEGIGLGLSIVRNFVEQSQGTVRLLSTPGSGTRVEMRLPLNIPPAL